MMDNDDTFTISWVGTEKKCMYTQSILDGWEANRSELWYVRGTK